ncbi:aminoglycoside 6'-N-acetyltransferase [Roseimicrobium sp. ORNL1]|uniref:aminoglycoside 6'-N-acetyltransferase n=1 Tax=Roseimicrobium sp. ORNL1 TaxID=2711231 RepID=UPI0013E0F5BB|nr:aminoglycoside 6'-N-acetyltransferase [Roseimicrobium sp. ORNL1]QIF04841.1 GNAT family N-acetyltransferase [Roseimicrobium sp. ORNL1]
MDSENTIRLVRASIRPAAPKDAAGWQKLRSQLWPDADSAREISQYFAVDPKERGQVFVAKSSRGIICGFIELSVRRDWVEGSTTSPTAYVEGLFVDQAHRREGIGRALLTAAEAWARDAGFKEIASDTLIDNEDSISAHLACGYAEVERTVHFIKPLRLTLMEFLKTAPQDDRFVQAVHTVFGPTNYCCPAHGTPLEIVDIYQTCMDISPLLAVIRASEGNPHHIHIGYRFEANDDCFRRPEKFPYCPVCEANYQAALASYPDDMI